MFKRCEALDGVYQIRLLKFSWEILWILLWNIKRQA